jgi:hypothetical protein
MTDDILARLAAPFPPDVVSWRIGSTNKEKTKGMALAYIDARDVQDRFDQVMGLDWQVRHPWAAGTKLACEIGLRINGEWLWRGDGAGDSDVEAEKGAFSDSFKRAAVRWGVGRYLYDVQSPWVVIEPMGRSFKIAESEKAKLRACLPKPGAPARQPAAAEPSPEPRHSASASEVRSIAARMPPHPEEPPEVSQERAASRKQWDEANAAYIRINNALKAADSLTVVQDIVKVNATDLALIKRLHEPSYQKLMQLAGARETEFLAAA